MNESNDSSEGADPMPGVQLEGQQQYPMLIEKIVTYAVVASSFLLIIPALSADLSLPTFLQYVLAFCGLPIAGFAIARLLIIPIHSVATEATQESSNQEGGTQ